VRWKRTLCAAQRVRNSSLRMDKLADEIGQAVVVRVASSLSAQDCHDVVGCTRLEIKNSRTSLRLSTKP
jgi:hypothetical protein